MCLRKINKLAFSKLLFHHLKLCRKRSRKNISSKVYKERNSLRGHGMMDRAHACHKAVRGLIPAASKCFITVAASRKMDPYAIKRG